MPELVVPTDYAASCSEMWTDPVALAAATGTTLDQATVASVQATWLISAMTQNRFHGWQCWVDDYRVSQLVANRYTSSFHRGIGSWGGWGGSGLSASPITGAFFPNSDIKFDITHGKISEIFSVTEIDVCTSSPGVSGFGSAPTAWCYLGRQRVSIQPALGPTCSFNNSPNLVRVHYKVAPNLVPGADQAVYTLATEYLKALTGGACMLPDRTSSIIRQGATWTEFDPQQLILNGLTGIKTIDRWVTITNGAGISGVIDPLYDPPIINSTLIGCGSSCTVVVP